MEFDTEIQNLQFNLDQLPHAILRAINEFTEQYEFRYEAYVRAYARRGVKSVPAFAIFKLKI